MSRPLRLSRSVTTTRGRVPRVQARVKASPTDADAVLYRVAGYTGLRLGELRALRRRDAEFPNGSLRVRPNLPVHATTEKVPRGKRVRWLPEWDQAALPSTRSPGAPT